MRMKDEATGAKPSTWRHVAFTLMVATIRVVFLIGIRLVYRVRAVHAERVPASGGVLLLPNHVTYADAFFLSAACPRPVRFVMDEAFIASPVIRWFTGIFGTVNIRRDQPLEAIREVIKALKKGGKLVMESYHKDQVNYKTGGPMTTTLLYSEEELRSDLSTFPSLIINQTIREVHEGEFHFGNAAVIQVLAEK